MRNWPPVDQSLRPAEKYGFDRNRRAVRLVLGGKRLCDAASESGLSTSRVSQLLDRCLSSTTESAPPLFYALIPGKHLRQKVRHAGLPSEASPSGANGAFTRLLNEVDGLKEGLDRAIEASWRESPNAERLTPSGAHAQFKRLLALANWPKDVYPYTTEKCAYESVRLYYHQLKRDLTNQRQLKRKQHPHASIGRFGRYALDEVQIDEHTVDFAASITLDLDNRLIPLRSARAVLILMIDKATNCILSYQLSPVHTASQDDLLALFENSLTPWVPRELHSEGLSYISGAAMPNSHDSPMFLAPKAYAFDNAMSHYALSVQNLVLKQLKATANYSQPASPLTRQMVEFAFQLINKRLTHRLPSTTGSHPQDPTREARKNRKHPPAVSYQAFAEALEVAITSHNVTPLASIGGATPLELLRHHRDNFFCCRPLDPLEGIQKWRPLVTTHSVALHRDDDRSRKPYINFCYKRYTGRCLSEVPGKETSILIQVDRRDIRRVRAITLNGRMLGELIAPSTWQSFPHSIRTRMRIMNKVKKHGFHGQDMLAAYFHELLNQRHHHRQAQEILRVYTEFNQGGRALDISNESKPAANSEFRWQSINADRRN